MIEVVKDRIIFIIVIHPLSGCPVWERQHKYNTMNGGKQQHWKVCNNCAITIQRYDLKTGYKTNHCPL